MNSRSKNDEPRRILIIRLSSIGDVVRTLPALTSLRRQYPESHIAWAVEDKSSSILEGHPDLDELLVFKRKEIAGLLKHPLCFFEGLSLLARFLDKIRGARYDLVLDFHGILKSGLIAAFTRSPNRVGFAKEFVKEFNHLFTNRKISPSDARLPRVTRNLELIRPYVSDENITDKPVIGITGNHREKARAFMTEKFGDHHPLVAIHPGTSRDIKKWSARSFAMVCDMVAESLDAKVVLTWGPGERGEAELIRSLANSRPEVGMRTDSLFELAAVLEACDLMITVDSGPMHIGSAVGTPVIAIFGPTDVQVNSPHWQPYELVSSNMECSPCDENCDLAECMAAVTPDAVVAAARKLLGSPNATERQESPAS
jgi:lipopolysaccharide heptosyltransferase I